MGLSAIELSFNLSRIASTTNIQMEKEREKRDCTFQDGRFEWWTIDDYGYRYCEKLPLLVISDFRLRRTHRAVKSVLNLRICHVKVRRSKRFSNGENIDVAGENWMVRKTEVGEDRENPKPPP